MLSRMNCALDKVERCSVEECTNFNEMSVHEAWCNVHEERM